VSALPLPEPGDELGEDPFAGSGVPSQLAKASKVVRSFLREEEAPLPVHGSLTVADKTDYRQPFIAEQSRWRLPRHYHPSWAVGLTGLEQQSPET
jgi:hypothetical protein